MPRRYWTADEVVSLRRLMNLEWTYAQIGAELGFSLDGVRTKVFRLGWAGRAGYLASRRMKGKKLSAKTKRKIGIASAQRSKSHEHRERFLRAVGSSEAEAKRLKSLTAFYDARRGGPIPKHCREAYDLARRKHLPAREAAIVAGAIPQPATEKQHGSQCSA